MLKYVKEIKNISKNKSFSITIAESCTGGMISSYLTKIDGSSDFFNGSVVSYSNKFKVDLLNISKNTIKKFGAVSHQTALEMVKGLKHKSNSEILISVTGVAGPKGGSKNTPVGTVYFGIGAKINGKYKFKSVKKYFKGSRIQIQKQSTEFALKSIIKELKLI